MIEKDPFGHEWELQEGAEEIVVKCLHCPAELKVSAPFVSEDSLLRRKLLAHNEAAMQPCARSDGTKRRLFRLVETTMAEVAEGDIFFGLSEGEDKALLLHRVRNPVGQGTPFLVAGAIGVISLTRADILWKEKSAHNEAAM